LEKKNPKLSQLFCPKSDKIYEEKITGILYNENNDVCLFEAFIPTHFLQTYPLLPTSLAKKWSG
jgi:hypothetical protein